MLRKFMFAVLRYMAALSAYPLWLVFFKRKVYYEDKKAQSRFVKGPALVISNHYCARDFMLMALMFPFRKLWVVLSEQMFRKSKFFDWAANIYGGICADRDIQGLRFVDRSIEVLEQGGLVQIFPEAYVTRTGKMQEFKTSYLLIALRAGVPLLPVMLDGNYGFRKRAHVMIGKPIDLNDYNLPLNPTREQLVELNEKIRDHCLALREELDRRIAADRKGRPSASDTHSND